MTAKAAARHPIRGYLFIAVAGLCWGISATLGKLAFGGQWLLFGHRVERLDAVALAQARVTLAFLLLVPLLLIFRGRRSLVLDRGAFLRCIALGVFGFAASNFFYYFAIDKGNVSTAIIVQYTAPVWVLLYMVARGREHESSVKVVAVVAAVLGCALAIGVGNLRGGLVWISVLAALGAAFSFSFYNIYARDLIAQHDRWTVLVYAMLGAVLFWLAIRNPSQVIAAHYSATQWEFMLLFSTVSMLIPFAFYFSGLQYLDATRAIVTSCLEPVFTVLIAAIVLGESFGALQVIGMLLVLAASVAIQVPQSGEAAHTSAAAGESSPS